MAIAAKFEADWSQFTASTKQANADLMLVQGTASKMGQAFASMDADRHLVRLSDATIQTSNSFGQLRLGLSQVDRTLSQFGVNLTPQVAALNEMSLAAGKTAAQLGVVATVGLTAAAALGGWQLGRFIADLANTDKWIGDLAASMLGYSEEAELAAHQTDVMARASNLAGREVTTFAEAVEILKQASADLADSLNTPAAVMDRMRGNIAAAQQDYRNLSEAQRTNITQMLEWGAKAADLEKTFNLHVGTIDVLIGRNKLLDEQEKINIRTSEARVTAINKVIAAQQKFIELAPLKPKDVTIGDAANPFQPTGAYKTILDQATATREWQESQDQMNKDIAEGARLLDEMGNKATEAGAKGVAGADAATAAYQRMGSAIAGAYQLAVPRDFSYAQAYADAGYFVHDSPFLGLSKSGEPRSLQNQAALGFVPRSQSITINVDGSGSFYDTPESRHRLGEIVGTAVESRLRSVGSSMGTAA